MGRTHCHGFHTLTSTLNSEIMTMFLTSDELHGPLMHCTCVVARLRVVVVSRHGTKFTSIATEVHVILRTKLSHLRKGVVFYLKQFFPQNNGAARRGAASFERTSPSV